MTERLVSLQCPSAKHFIFAENFESGDGNSNRAIVSPTALKTSVVAYQLGRRESLALDRGAVSTY